MMYKENNNLGNIDNEFRELLRSNDEDYASKIGYVICCPHINGYYKIEIFPLNGNKEADARKYFKDNFEKGELNKKLAEFSERNNIGKIVFNTCRK